MTFLLTKIALALVLPPASLLLIMVAGLLIMGRSRILGRLLLFTGLALLYLLSVAPVSDALLRPLERYSTPFAGRYTGREAIVVLAGGARHITWTGLPVQPSATSLERVVYGVQLQRDSGGLPLVISGGSGNPALPGISEGEAMAEVARALGVSRKDLIVEDSSRNTIENARNVLKVLGNGRRIILVTSASHMARSSAMFMGEGFDVLPAPCGYRSEDKPLAIGSFIPRAAALNDSSTALYEYFALVWYRFRGGI
ncbi:MAG: YdcF family protein [Thermodesulfobacteriota bacterium]